MLALVLDVVDHVGDCGPRNGEGSVTFLPGEMLEFFELLVDPER